MLKNGWLLSTVAFIVSFMLSLLVNRDIGKAFVTGAIAVPAAFGGAFVVNGVERMQHRRVLTVLEMEIEEMQEWQVELYHSLSVMAAQEQRTEIQVNNLKRQLNQISSQTSEQQRYQRQVERELIILTEQRQKLESDVRDWETQLYHLEQQREELDLSVRSLAAEKHNIELILNTLRNELQNLQIENEEEFAIELDAKEIDSIFTILDVEAEEVPNETSEEWVKFVAELTNSEREVLKAIVQAKNPSAAIKKIAETYITMPELLIDAINQRAIATIGDIIIEPGSVPPVITEEDYLTKIKEVLNI